MTTTETAEARARLISNLRAEAARNGGNGAYAWRSRELCGQAASEIERLASLTPPVPDVERLTKLASERMWRIHPNDLDKMGFIHKSKGGEYDNPRAAYYAFEIMGVVKSALASPTPPAQGEEWRWVPVEPTEEMLSAWALSDKHADDWRADCISGWAAMLSAIPDASPGSGLRVEGAGWDIPESDRADILETIDDAAPDWRDKGYTTALAEVRDMAAVGREVMERIEDNRFEGSPIQHWTPADSPAEIVTDMLNMIEAATRSTPTEDRLRSALERIVKEADEPRKFWSKRIGDIARAALSDAGEERA